MDPISIAISSTAVSLLSPYLKTLTDKVVEKGGEAIGKAAGEVAWKKAKELYETIRKKFSGDPSAEQTLAALAKTPENKEQQAEVERLLKEAVSSDENFAKQLANILREAADAGADNVFNTNIYGEVQKFVQIGTVHGDVHI